MSHHRTSYGRGLNPNNRVTNRKPNQDNRQVGHSNGRPDNRPDNRPGNRPDNRPDKRPDNHQDNRSENYQNTRPDNRSEKRSDNRIDNRQDGYSRSDRERDDRKKFFMELNRSLIEWIFESVDVGKYNYKILKTEAELSSLLTNRYYLSGNYSGNNCFLVFTKHKGKYHSFIIERKMLSYSIDKVDWDTLRITNVNAMVDQAIYDGTIFDGIYFSRGDISKFTITDVYRFRGADYAVRDIKLKLAEIRAYLERIGSQIVPAQKQNNRVNIEISVNQLHDILDFDDVVNNKLHNNQTMVRGICFYPEQSGTKLIFNYDHHPNILANHPANGVKPQKVRVNKLDDSNNSGSEGSTHSKPQNSGDVRRKLTKTYYTAIDRIENGSDIEIKAILRMEPTPVPDNYDLYCVERISSNKLKKQKRDIAYVPDVEKSKWLRELFVNNSKPKLMNCVWRDDRRKWEPMSVNETAKFPTLASQLDKHLIAMEESDSESDFE